MCTSMFCTCMDILPYHLDVFGVCLIYTSRHSVYALVCFTRWPICKFQDCMCRRKTNICKATRADNYDNALFSLNPSVICKSLSKKELILGLSLFCEEHQWRLTCSHCYDESTKPWSFFFSFSSSSSSQSLL
jgi:hypothetical protein